MGVVSSIIMVQWIVSRIIIQDGFCFLLAVIHKRRDKGFVFSLIE